MKYVRDLTGRFHERPHFEPGELDTTCDRAMLEHVEACGGKLEYPISTDVLQTLIEAHAESLDLYADLSAAGVGVQGVTDFFPGKRPKVRIDAGLATDAHREVRLRTTLGHEFGHVHLHDSLFQAKSSEIDMFAPSKTPSANPSARVAQCKRDTIVSATTADWMEWQAGYVCGALLMPRRLLRDLVHSRMHAAKHRDALTLESALGGSIVSAVAEAFFVSTEAARVRMKVLGMATDRPIERSVFD